MMRVGILTLHASHNYGALLQCMALHSVLKEFGCDVKVVDRWITDDNRLVRWPLTNSFRDWMKYLIRGLVGCGDFRRAIRSFRTMSFLRRLDLTPYHFMKWEEASRPLGFDCVVVGSDQVWQPFWTGSNPYLGHGAPDGLERISYAASFGVPGLPSEKIEVYKEALNRFRAISCRESSGVEIVRRLGLNAAHVVDPTLLVSPEFWHEIVSRKENRKKKLVCYFLSEKFPDCLSLLNDFANEHDVEVELFSDGYLKSLSWGIHDILSFKVISSRIQVRYAAGPLEFLQSIANATWVLTDSFHGLMFSSIFERNVRFIRPHDEKRRVMFARVDEFAKHYMTGPVFVDDLKSGLPSFLSNTQVGFRHDEIETWRQKSIVWLKGALGI